MDVVGVRRAQCAAPDAAARCEAARRTTTGRRNVRKARFQLIYKMPNTVTPKLSAKETIRLCVHISTTTTQQQQQKTAKSCYLKI